MREIIDIGIVGYVSLLSYIDDNNLSEGDVIHISYEDYKDLIADCTFVSEPCYIKDVYIKTSDVDKGHIQVIKCTLSPPQSVEKDIYPRYPVIYRCGWCGNIVAEDGSLVDPRTRENVIKTIQRFGDEVRVVAVSGACCPNEDKNAFVQTDLERDTEEFERIVKKIFEQNKANPKSNTKDDVYRINIKRFKEIQLKSISEIAEDDLTFLGFERIQNEEFEVLYNYKDFGSIKMYFNRSSDRFEMRGFRLRKEKDINTTQELINSSLIYWKLKMDM